MSLRTSPDQILSQVYRPFQLPLYHLTYHRYLILGFKGENMFITPLQPRVIKVYINIKANTNILTTKYQLSSRISK